jgi:hypothetical protein
LGCEGEIAEVGSLSRGARDVALTGEGEAIRLELTVDYFFIDHDTVSRVGEPLANLISEAPRLFLELAKRLEAEPSEYA